MMSYNNVFEIMIDTHSKSFVKLVCCNVGKEIHYVTVNIIITSGKLQTSLFIIMQTASGRKLQFAGFLVPSCPKHALVWGMVVRGFARRDLC